MKTGTTANWNILPTQLLSNEDCSFENGTVGNWGNLYHCTLVNDAANGYHGSHSAKMTVGLAGTTQAIDLVAGITSAGTQYAFSGKFKGTIGRYYRVTMYDDISGTTYGTQILADGTWQTATVTKIYDAGSTTRNIAIRGQDAIAGDIIYWDSCILLAGASATPPSNSGTDAIDDLERLPYTFVETTYPSPVISLDTSGSAGTSFMNEQFIGTALSPWLEASGAGGTSVTVGGGTCQIAKGGTNEWVGIAGTASIKPEDMKLVYRVKSYRGTENPVCFPVIIKGSSEKPALQYDADDQPSLYFAGEGTIRGFFGGVGAVYTTEAPSGLGNKYIFEAEYLPSSGSICNINIFNASNMSAPLFEGTKTFNFPSGTGIWPMSLNALNSNPGTYFLDSIQFWPENSPLSISTPAENRKFLLKGSDDALVGSCDSTGIGTSTISFPNTEYPYFGYVELCDSTAGTVQARYPDSNNGTFWPGELLDASGTTVGTCQTENVLSISGRAGYEDFLTGLVPSGAIAGDIDIEVKGGSKFSQLNANSPYYNHSMINKSFYANAGFVTENGSEYLQQFEGFIDNIEINSADRVTAIHASDKSELLKRKKITLPLMKDVDSDYLVRAVLAEADISDGQVNDNQTDFMCKFDNSTTSEQGHEATAQLGPAYSTGKWGDANGALSTSTLKYNSFNGDYFTSGFLASWQYPNTTGNENMIDFFESEDNYFRLDVRYDFIRVYAIKDGVSETLYNGGNPNDDSWNHLVLTWDSEVENKLFIYLNGSELTNVSLGTKMPDGNVTSIHIQDAVGNLLDHVSIGPHFRTAKDIKNMYTAATADDDETDIDPGYNTINYVWLNERNAWNVIKDICEAEGATAYFDSAGKFHFENRYHRLKPPYHRSQKTISYDADATGLTINENIENIINRTVVKAAPLRKQGGSITWSADDTIKIPPNSTRTFWAGFDSPVLGAVTTFTGSAGTASGSSVYEARRYYRGSYLTDMKANVSLHGTAFAKSMKILGSNTHANRTAYLVGTEGSPHVHVWGSEIKTTESESGASEIYMVQEDTASIAAVGEKTMSVENDFITDTDYAEWLAEYLLMIHNNPRPSVQGVTIAADPRLEPGDRITLTDSSGVTGLNDDFWLMNVDWGITPGYTESIDVIYADKTNYFILDDPVNGRLDLNVLAF